MDTLHYSDIYDFEEKNHSTPRYDALSKVWRYYEGYGQSNCQEKAQFLRSINSDHPLWSGETPERDGKSRHIYTAEARDIVKKLSAADKTNDDFKRVNFLTETWEGHMFGLPQGSKPVMILDGRDRIDRPSWNFAKMLCDYYEKADGSEEKKNFFKDYGHGAQWSKNIEMMKEFKPFFEKIVSRLDDEDYKISLSDQSIKNYPRFNFLNIYKRYNEFMDSVEEPKTWDLNPAAKEFIPNCFSVPFKPEGPPPPRRPSASCKNTTEHVLWENNRASYEELSDKLDKIIQVVDTPVVYARRV